MADKKKILLYSIQHTGTHFLRNLIETSTPPNRIVRPARYDKLRGVRREQFTLKDLIQHSTNALSAQQLRQADLIMFFGHHFRPDAKLFKDISCNRPIIPCVSPMRDPLLHVNTYLFWGNRYRRPKDWRQNRVKTAVNAFLRILSLPDKHRFLFPVDLSGKQKQKTRCKKLFEFCELEMTPRTQKFIQAWRPAHKTQRTPTHGKTFARVKSAILAKDSNALRRMLKIEFDYLQRQENLKKKLEKYGYKDLVWW